MSGHTPGPWVVEPGKPLMVVAERGGFAVILSEPGKKITRADKANACLIATAPDLLQALHDELSPSRSDCNDRRCGNCTRCRSLAAIAKAEGR